MFAYPDEEFYANMKVEILPEKNYPAIRAALTDDFDHMLASGGTVRNYDLKSTLNGFDIRGLDREKIEGGVLGIYLLFDDATHMVTTIYFLNQEHPHFHSVAEYGMLRNRFLAGYTSCVRNKKV